MKFWEKWLHISLVFILTLSLLSPAVVQAEGLEDVQNDETTDIQSAVSETESEVTPSDSAGVEKETTEKDKTEKDKTDEAVTHVEALITALPSIEQGNAENERALQTARASYDALTEDQQALVTNLNELVEKEVAFLALQKAASIVSIAPEKSTGAALSQVMGYLSHNVPSISNARSYTALENETQLLLGLKGAGIDVATFNWAQMNSPFDEGTFWESGSLPPSLPKNNPYYLNALLGAYVLEINPYNAFGEKDLLGQLKSSQSKNGAKSGTFTSMTTFEQSMQALLALNVIGAEQLDVNPDYTLDYIFYSQYDTKTGLISKKFKNTGWAMIVAGQYPEFLNGNRALSVWDEISFENSPFYTTIAYLKEKPNLIKEASPQDVATFVSGLIAIGEDVHEITWPLGDNGELMSIVDYLVRLQKADGSFGSEEDTLAALIALGDVQAGQTIYERLKQLKNITRTVDLQVEGPDSTLFNGSITAVDYPEAPTLKQLVEKAVPGIDLTKQQGNAKWYYTKDYLNVFDDFTAGAINNEKVVVYYGAKNAVTDEVLPLEDITFTNKINILTPKEIMAGEPFEVQVTAKSNHYDASGKIITSGYEVEHKIAGATIVFNGEKYTTNVDGIIEIPGEKAQVGAYELQVSKDIEGSYPRMLRQSKKIIVQEDETPTKDIQVIIEGPTKKIHEITVNIKENKTVYDATVQAFEENNIQYKATKTTGIFTEIADIKQGTFKGWDGWNYTTNNIVYSLNNAPEQSLNGINEIIWYYGAEGDLYTGLNSLDENMTLKPFIKLQNTAVEGKDLTIQITGQHRIYNALSQIIEEKKVVSLAGATVTFNGKTYKTDEQGSVTIPGGNVIAGATTIEVSHYVDNNYPKIVRTDFIVDVKKEATVTVDIRIEGYKGTIANEKNVTVAAIEKVTAVDVTEQVLKALDVPYKKSSSGVFGSINNEASSALSMASGWVYKVNEVYPNVYAPDLEVKTGDEIVWHYTNYTSIVENEYYGTYIGSGIDTVDKVTFEPIIEMPQQAKVGEPLKIKITGKYNIVDFGFVAKEKGLTANLDQVTIEFNDKQYVTDTLGEVTIPAEDLIVGKYELKFTKDLPGIMTVYGKEKVIESYPRIIRTYKLLEVTTEEITKPGEPDLENEKDETLGDVNGDLTNKEKAQQALQKANGYLLKNNNLVSERVNESHSGFWMLSAMYAAGIDIQKFDWATKPTATGTHWTTPISSAMAGANEDAGTIIGAKILGLDATNLKGRNLIKDLATKQQQNNTFGLLTYEPWVMIAMDLVNGVYDQQAHINYLLSIQDKKTGYFGTIEATGWILMALATHQDQPAVKAAIDLAVASYNQDYVTLGFTDDSNVMSTIIGGLAAVGEDVFSDKWTYEKEGKRINLVGYLVDNYILEDGGVRYQKNLTTSSLMSLEQTYIALANALTKTSIYNEIKDGKQIDIKPSTPSEEDNEQPSPAPSNLEVNASISIAGVLSQTAQILPQNSTVFDALMAAVAENGVTIQYRTTSLGKYVYGINGLKEFDKGAGSGWMYRVNDIYPNVSADMYVLQPGDRIEWLYTTDLGGDIGSVSGGSETEKPVEVEKEVTEEKELIVEQQDNQATVELTKEKLEQYTSGTTNLVIKNEQGQKIEVNQSILQRVKLAEDEKLVVSVQQDQKAQTINIQLAIVSSQQTTPLSTEKEYVKVTLPAPQATANTVVLQLVDGEYRAVPHKIVDGEIILFVKSSGSFILVEESVTFGDIQNIANQEEIEFLASHHIIKGKDGESFAPNETVTRAQFATMISRALGLQAQGKSKFTDTKGKWYEKDVQALSESGITNGKTANTFDPEAEITRQQAAALMARILDYVNYQAEAGQLNFKDAEKISAEFKEAIALLNQLEIMTGKDDGTFDATGSLTRVQMAKILKRTLEIAGLI